MISPVHHGPVQRVAFQVTDDSANRVIQSGGFAIALGDVDADPMRHDVGALLVIERTRNGLTERSIRRIYRKTKSVVELVCDSTRRRYQRDRVRVPTRGETVKVVGLVVGKYHSVTAE
jgi:hypothetical protein